MIVGLLYGWMLLSLTCAFGTMMVILEDFTPTRIRKYKFGRMYFEFKKNWSRLLYIIGIILAIPVVILIQFIIWLGKDAS